VPAERNYPVHEQELLAIVTAPVVLYLLSEALGFAAEVSAAQVARTVGQAILLPVLLGLVVRFLWPQIADKIGPTLGKVGEIVLYVLLIPVLVRFLDLLLKMDLWSYVVMAVFIVVNLAIGHVLAPREAPERVVLAMESGARNFGLALTIGALNFSQEGALPVLVPYVILFLVISTIYLKGRQRQLAS